MSEIFAENCVLMGEVDYYCVVCGQHMYDKYDVLKHILDSDHKENLSSHHYTDKYKQDLIRKVAGVYLCEVCNTTLPTGAKVRLHVTEHTHLERKRGRMPTRANKCIVFHENILITENAWNGLIDDTCVLCNVEFENDFTHTAERNHILNLVQSRVIINARGDIYRQVEGIYQCLTCNEVLSASVLIEHLDSLQHKDLLRKCAYDINITINEKSGKDDARSNINVVDKSTDSHDIILEQKDVHNEKHEDTYLKDETADINVAQNVVIVFNKSTDNDDTKLKQDDVISEKENGKYFKDETADKEDKQSNINNIGNSTDNHDTKLEQDDVISEKENCKYLKDETADKEDTQSNINNIDKSTDNHDTKLEQDDVISEKENCKYLKDETADKEDTQSNINNIDKSTDNHDTKLEQDDVISEKENGKYLKDETADKEDTQSNINNIVKSTDNHDTKLEQDDVISEKENSKYLKDETADREDTQSNINNIGKSTDNHDTKLEQDDVINVKKEGKYLKDETAGREDTQSNINNIGKSTENQYIETIHDVQSTIHETNKGVDPGLNTNDEEAGCSTTITKHADHFIRQFGLSFIDVAVQSYKQVFQNYESLLGTLHNVRGRNKTTKNSHKNPTIINNENKKVEKLNKIFLKEFIKRQEYINIVPDESIVKVPYIYVNNTLFLNCSKFLGIARKRDNIICQFCRVNLTPLNLDTHINSSQHKDLIERCYLIMLPDNEFVRQLKPDMFDCAYCGHVENEWEYMMQHVDTEKHMKCKNEHDTLMFNYKMSRLQMQFPNTLDPGDIYTILNRLQLI